MYEYVKGNIIEITPTYVILETPSFAYHIEISLQTYTTLQQHVNKPVLVYTHFIVREDAHILFGFSSKSEREWFRLLISVSGIGANTARTILSAVSCQELESYIASTNVNELKSIKGIGQKTAERLIVELRDKIGKTGSIEEIFSPSHNRNKEEALSALLMLGYPKSMAEKVINKILKSSPSLLTEELIKQALKQL